MGPQANPQNMQNLLHAFSKVGRLCKPYSPIQRIQRKVFTYYGLNNPSNFLTLHFTVPVRKFG